jgi:ribonuclease VapC
MVVDTSALVAVLKREPGWQRWFDAMLEAGDLRVSAASWVELGIVAIAKLRPEAEVEIEALQRSLEIRIVPFDAEQATLAREAFRRFGKGRHAAALNFGDCLTYALARQQGAPLLFVGDDFARTDLEPALPV